jgi:hypothetical protein
MKSNKAIMCQVVEKCDCHQECESERRVKFVSSQKNKPLLKKRRGFDLALPDCVTWMQPGDEQGAFPIAQIYGAKHVRLHHTKQIVEVAFLSE